MNVARFLLRDGSKVGAEVSPEGLDVFSYEDQKGQVIHALATVKAEREFLRQVPSKLLPLYVRMEHLLPRPFVGAERFCRSFSRETIGQMTARSWFRRP